MYKPKLSSADLPEELVPLREAMAEKVHDMWAAGRINDGWKYGQEHNEALKTHPDLVPYCNLPESEKEYDRRTATATILCLLENGYSIVKD